MGEAAPQAARTARPGSARDQALEALIFHWGGAYEIGEDEENGWWAKRRDGLGGRITAADPDNLDRDVWDDYKLNPVPREFDPEEAVMTAPETTLDEVISRWGDDYKMGGNQEEGYWALRKGGAGPRISAGTPGELWDLLVLDFLDLVTPGAGG